MSGKGVIIDTDILSMFAKVDAVDMLEEFLGIGQIALTPAIRDEISIPLYTQGCDLLCPDLFEFNK